MKKMTKKPITVLMLLFFVVMFTSNTRGQANFTPEDRKILIELKAVLTQIDKRFEQVDKRFTELREDMNNRFEDMNNRFEEVDRRFEEVDRRFGQVDKHIDQFMIFVGIVAGFFATMTAVTIGFALWDRRSMIRPFETKVFQMDEKIKKNNKNHDQLIGFLEKYAEKDKKFAHLAQQFNLF